MQPAVLAKCLQQYPTSLRCHLQSLDGFSLKRIWKRFGKRDRTLDLITDCLAHIWSFLDVFDTTWCISRVCKRWNGLKDWNQRLAFTNRYPHKDRSIFGLKPRIFRKGSVGYKPSVPLNDFPNVNYICIYGDTEYAPAVWDTSSWSSDRRISVVITNDSPILSQCTPFVKSLVHDGPPAISNLVFPHCTDLTIKVNYNTTLNSASFPILQVLTIWVSGEIDADYNSDGEDEDIPVITFIGEFKTVKQVKVFFCVS